MKITIFALLGLLLAATVLFAVDPQQLDSLQLPEGFAVEVYAEGIRTARGLDFAENGTLFVGSKQGGLYAVTSDRSVLTIDTGLNMPVGLDYHQGSLYVSAVSRILQYENILSSLADGSTADPVVLNDSYPQDRHHGWKFIKIGPDGFLYVPVGAPCNVCTSSPANRYAGITRLNLETGDVEWIASGVRNTVGFDWHPDTGELWFTENGRDLLGDDVPPDELNRLPSSAAGSMRPDQTPHFGFPYLHGSDVKDPKFWRRRPKIDFLTPEYEFQAHVAALGMRFYTSDHFPERYRGGIFVAQHGSWNRSKKVGYRVVFLKIEDNRVVDSEVFARGWLQQEKAWGRPADVAVGPDGALYVADDQANCVYRISYQGN